MVRDTQPPRNGTPAHIDPNRPPGSPEDSTPTATAPRNAVQALESEIALQEELVAMLRARQETRRRMLRQVRDVLGAGRAVEATGLQTEADALRTTLDDDVPEGTVESHTERQTDEEAEAREGPKAAGQGASPTEPAAVTATTRDSVESAEAALADLLRHVEASLARAERTAGCGGEGIGIPTGVAGDVHAEDEPLATTTTLTMDDLLGLTEEREESSKKAKRQRHRRAKKSKARADALAAAAAAPDAGDGARMTARDMAARQALFDALDAVVDTLPRHGGAAATAGTTTTTTTTTQPPAWLLEEPEATASESRPSHDVKQNTDDGTPGAEKEQTDAADADYSDDFEDDGEP